MEKEKRENLEQKLETLFLDTLEDYKRVNDPLVKTHLLRWLGLLYNAMTPEEKQRIREKIINGEGEENT